MIEAITKIPIEVLESQINNTETSLNPKEKFLIIFLDENFQIKENFNGTYDEITTNFPNLTKLQKDLIEKFNDYRGISEFGGNFNRFSFGGNQALGTCSLLHYDFSKKGGTIRDNLLSKDNNKKTFNIEKVLEVFKNIEEREKKKKTKYDNLIFDNEEIRKNLNILIKQFFLEEILKTQDLKYFESKIIVIPSENAFIEKFNKFHNKFIKIQSGKDKIKDFMKFNYDTFSDNSQVIPLSQLYSKFNSEKGIIYQDEECNLIKKENFEKLDLFQQLLVKKKLNILPIPNFETDSTNIYNKCFLDKTDKEGSILHKLKYIYEDLKRPFNYSLISKFNNEWRFENVVNYNFDTFELINEEVFDLNFNKYTKNKEERQILIKSNSFDKFNLFYDISFLFWNLKEDETSNSKQESFFNPEIKYNPILDSILKQNAESIINLIFKNDKAFIFRLEIVINQILDGILRSSEIRERFDKSFFLVKKLILIYLKYEPNKKMSQEYKKIEEKLKNFQISQNLDEIEENNDVEAYFYAGIIIKHILRAGVSSKSDLQIFSKNLISVSSSEQLKMRIIELTEKYSHNLKVNPKMWRIINQKLLKYQFENDKIRNNLIPLFVGFYSDFNLKEINGENN